MFVESITIEQCKSLYIKLIIADSEIIGTARILSDQGHMVSHVQRVVTGLRVGDNVYLNGNDASN